MKKEKKDKNLDIGPKWKPDAKTNWSTVCRPQEELQLRTSSLRESQMRQ
jgi:hypothetical protein